MRLILILAALVVLVALAAAVTRPGPAEFDAMLDEAIRARVANTDLEAGGDALPTLALAACKLRPSDCAAVVRQALDIRVDERAFTTHVTVEGFRRSTTCTGAFGRFFCKGLLAE